MAILASQVWPLKTEIPVSIEPGTSGLMFSSLSNQGKLLLGRSEMGILLIIFSSFTRTHSRWNDLKAFRQKIYLFIVILFAMFFFIPLGIADDQVSYISPGISIYWYISLLVTSEHADLCIYVARHHTDTKLKFWRKPNLRGKIMFSVSVFVCLFKERSLSHDALAQPGIPHPSS